MPRRKRALIDNACYHITHRCHNCEFLFQHKKYRRFYLRHLFEMQKRYGIDVWSKALAVGDEGWLKEQASGIGLKRFKIQRNENISYAIG